ncbi:hypothetical protein [Streptomyces sp. BE303]|uniref:hypothetical protein n=1 Tax=Streptomyces sp. BE303 TaxID=3002528 RepID=UPI002E76CC56|nr:hypothetical protein [Streptomyces sp. BE303]MED7950251.1 hypothetical protein [Streptomyces sp. BE303]
MAAMARTTRTTRTGRFGRAVASAAVVVGLALAGTVGTATSAQAFNSVWERCSTEGPRTDPTLGGPYLCGGRWGSPWYVHFPDKVEQVFAVGTDFAVWSTWTGPGTRQWGPWVSMGGRVTGGVSVASEDGYVLQLVTTGTDGKLWYNTRGRNGVWTGWFR